MKKLHILGIFLSVFAIGCFVHGGVHDTEAIAIGFNCMLIGVNYKLWRIS